MGVGRKPKPAELKILQGNPGKRPVVVPIKSGKIGAAPKGMTELAREKWADCVEEFGLYLAASDRSALRIFCETWAEMIHAEKMVAESGSMVLTPNGMVQKSPWLTKVEHCRESLRKWLSEFHGTPSARARASAGIEPEAANPFEALG